MTRLSKITEPSSVISVGTLPNGLTATSTGSRLTGCGEAGTSSSRSRNPELVRAYQAPLRTNGDVAE